jgi:hypothetical protein
MEAMGNNDLMTQSDVKSVNNAIIRINTTEFKFGSILAESVCVPFGISATTEK